MSSQFVTALENEEKSLIAELEQSSTYRRLRRVQELLVEYRQGLPSAPIADVKAAVAAASTNRRREKTQTILDAVANILRDSSEPMKTGNILRILRERGVDIPGEKALNNLSAIISYSKMFESHGRLGWTLSVETKKSEAADAPNLAGRTSTASVSSAASPTAEQH